MLALGSFPSISASTSTIPELINFLFFLFNLFEYQQSRRKMPAKAAKKENLDDLKQELDIDHHKISPEDLYQRFQTHPENVSYLRIALLNMI